MKTPTYSVEVITLPVSDVERALRFYVDQVGFTLDVDYWPNDALRVVQLTPPGSSCSLQIGKGLTDALAGSLRDVFLVVTDIEAARSRLLEQGVEVGEIRVGEIRHKTPIGVWAGGFSPWSRPRTRRLCELRQVLRSGWEYLGTPGKRLPQGVTRRENYGIVLATRSAFTRRNRPVSPARTTADETVVRGAIATAHARSLRWELDRRHRRCHPAVRTRPLSYFKETDVTPGTLEITGHITQHADLGVTSWYAVQARGKTALRGAWQDTNLPSYAQELQGRVAFAWPAMEAFFEEDERIMGHAADSYHRIDIHQSSRNLVVRSRDRIIADTKRPLVLYESGFAPRWYVPRADIHESDLTPVAHRTFCSYKGLCRYYDIGETRLAAWSYQEPYAEVSRINDLVSFEPDIARVHLDGVQLHLASGQTVIPHGPDRDLDVPITSGKQP